MATVKFIQAQKFSLSGAGSSIGDTTITLQSMLGIDSVALVTADIGVKGFGTLEPGNGVQEEQISFTGITQNANGTATLTGVKTVAFISPYTETSGLAKTHAGASTFILSNDAGFYGQILSYVDTALSSGAIPATTLVNGISTLSVSPATAAQPVVIGTNDPRVPTQTEKNYLASVVSTAIPYAVATGTASAYTVTLASSIATLASGTHLNFLVPVTNASGVTLNINSLGAKTLKKSVNTTLSSGDITIGQIIEVAYDGTNFQVTSPVTSSPIKSGVTTRAMDAASGAVTIAHGLGVIPRYIRMTARILNTNATALMAISDGSYNGSTTACVYLFRDSSTASVMGTDTTNIIKIIFDASGREQNAVATFDITNITLTWTKVGSTPSISMQIMWEAFS